MNNSSHSLLTELNTQTILVCALACEAKPFIDLLKLKKVTDVHAFSLYQSGSVFVLVTGIGQINMSAGVNWLNGYLNNQNAQFWLNIGVAGHQSAEIGSLFCTHKITHEQHTLYPTKWLKHNLDLAPLLTVKQEETLYQESSLYDMEGFAFYQSAIRFNSQECVQCLKVVSDNPKHPVNRDKTFISHLIASQCDAILDFITLHTTQLEEQLHQSFRYEKLHSSLIKEIHFSHSQKLQLTKLCQAAQSHDVDLLNLQLAEEQTAKAVLERVKQHLDNHLVAL